MSCKYWCSFHRHTEGHCLNVFIFVYCDRDIVIYKVDMFAF